MQYTVLYCRKKNQCIAMGIVLQDGCRRPKCVAIQNCIVTTGAGAGRRRGAGRARRGVGRRHGRAAGAGSRRGRGARGVRPGRWAPGLALGCALGALGLFSIRFDSVLFLSRFLDIVREPSS